MLTKISLFAPYRSLSIRRFYSTTQSKRWTKLVRFRNDKGEIHYGEAHYSKEGKIDTAKIIKGDIYTNGVVTDTFAPIVKLLAPIEPTSIFCIGLNYKKHAQESNLPVPKKPSNLHQKSRFRAKSRRPDHRT